MGRTVPQQSRGAARDAGSAERPSEGEGGGTFAFATFVKASQGVTTSEHRLNIDSKTSCLVSRAAAIASLTRSCQGRGGPASHAALHRVRSLTAPQLQRPPWHLIHRMRRSHRSLQSARVPIGAGSRSSRCQGPGNAERGALQAAVGVCRRRKRLSAAPPNLEIRAAAKTSATTTGFVSSLAPRPPSVR